MTNSRLPSVVSSIPPDLRAFTERVREFQSQPVANVAKNAVGTANMTDHSVVTAKLAAGAVLAEKIAKDAVTTDKLIDGGVTTDKLIDGGVTTAKLVDGGVTTAKLVDGGVTTDKLVDGGVTTDKLATGAATADKVGNLPASKITSGTFDVSLIPNLDASKITAGTLDLARLPQVCDLIVTAASTDAVFGTYSNMVSVTTTGVSSSTKVVIVGIVAGYASRPSGTGGFGLLARLRRGASSVLRDDQYVTYAELGTSDAFIIGGSRVMFHVETISSNQSYYLDAAYSGAANAGGCTDASLFVFRLR